jgi:hypothetical protein
LDCTTCVIACTRDIYTVIRIFQYLVHEVDAISLSPLTDHESEALVEYLKLFMRYTYLAFIKRPGNREKSDRPVIQEITFLFDPRTLERVLRI